MARIPAASSGPTSAPTWSKASCRPNAQPRTAAGHDAHGRTTRAQQREIGAGDRPAALVDHVGEEADNAEQDDQAQGCASPQCRGRLTLAGHAVEASRPMLARA